MNCLKLSSPEILHHELEERSGHKLILKINNNHSTMISIRREMIYTRISLHRMFLEAPSDVLDALAQYIRGKHKRPAPVVKLFIEKGLRTFDYSNKVDTEQLITQGEVYNLQELYDEINDKYFQRRQKITITWFGQRYRRNRRGVTFGLYCEPLKLIKIHRILDDLFVPRYVIAFIVYHEMLHADCPSFVDEQGAQRSHGEEYKKREKQYEKYSQARSWIKNHKDQLFGKSRGKKYGWS